MAEISEFQYAYFSCEVAIVRIKIPTLNTSYEPEFEILFEDQSQPLPINAGLFSHHHIVYMVGGHNVLLEHRDRVLMFDTTKSHPFPKPLTNSNFAPMAFPNIIRAGDRVYLITVNDLFYKGLGELWEFQYFDPTQNLFKPQPPPPLPTPPLFPGFLYVAGHFFLGDYIYVSIRKGVDYFNLFKFDTKESKWEDGMSLVDKFKEKNIPFPSSNGDVGLSDEFDDNTWILVVLDGDLPTAYNIRLHDKGDIEPISYRVLYNCKLTNDDGRDYFERADGQIMAYMGGGRFCVGLCTLIYVFTVNFALEHRIQTTPGSVGVSSCIIFSKKFNPDDIISGKFLFAGFCIGPAPASPYNEDQDRDGGKMKRKREAAEQLFRLRIGWLKWLPVLAAIGWSFLNHPRRSWGFWR